MIFKALTGAAAAAGRKVHERAARFDASRCFHFTASGSQEGEGGEGDRQSYQLIRMSLQLTVDRQQVHSVAAQQNVSDSLLEVEPPLVASCGSFVN